MCQPDKPKGFFLCLRPDRRQVREASVLGLSSELLCDDSTPTESLMAGVVVIKKRGELVPLHYHGVEELQYILYGHGVVRDIDGNEYEIWPDVTIYCAPGLDGAHEVENTGNLPLGILFVYASPGGKEPDCYFVEE